MNYLNLFYDFIFEEYLKLDAPLYYSQPLKDTLRALSNKGDNVAKILYYAEQSDEYKTDMTYVDLGNGNDKVSFIQVNRVLRMLDKEAGDPESKNQGKILGQLPDDYLNKMYRLKNNKNNAVWNQQRTELSVGKFVTKVLQKTTDALIKVNQNDINAFVDKFKAYRDFQTTKKEKFEIVDGEDIRKWYDEDTYEDAQYHLSNSCMRYERCQDYLDIYTMNPNQVSMVIMKGTSPDKIIGRALIWKLSDGDTYLDRPYANNDEDVNLFKEWGRSKGYRVYGDGYQHKEVKLDIAQFDKYPYMDTFKYLNRGDKLLSTDANEFDDGNEDWIRLEDTGGGFEEAHQGVWSEYYQEYIDEDSAVYAEDIQSYIHSDDAYYLEYKDEYVSNESDVVHSEYDGQYYLSDDAVHSEYLDDYIYSENAIEVHYTLEDTTYVPDNFMIRGLADEYFINNETMTCLSTMVFKSPFAKEYFFRFGTVQVYKLEDGSMVTEAEAEEKDIDVSRIDTEWVEIDDYLNKVPKITREQFLEKLKVTEITSAQLINFKEIAQIRGGFRSDLRRFFNDSSEDEVKGAIRLFIYFGYNISDTNEYGKPRRKNRGAVILDNVDKANQFVDVEIVQRLSSSSLELLIELCDAQISNLISDKDFLAQIILLKNNL